MNQEIKNQDTVENAIKEIADCFEGTFSYHAGHIRGILNSLIDKTVQIERERIVDLIERQYGDVVTTNKDVAIPHNCLEYETALDDIITLITNKSDINKDTL